jgi:Acidic N-terminal SPT6
VQGEGARSRWLSSESNLASAPMDHSAVPWAGQKANNRMELDEPIKDNERRSDEEGDNNMSTDSSEEEEDDPEEARKIQEGFIVDEEEEDEEEGSGDEEKSKERHKGSHKKRRRRKGQRLPMFSYLIADSDLLQKDAQRKKKEAKPASLTRKIWNL